MPYGETKVYFDGSHYIAIPHTTRPSRKRPVRIEEEITVYEDSPASEETTDTATGEEKAEVVPVELAEEAVVNIIDTPENKDAPAEENAVTEKKSGGRKTTRKELFEKLYKETMNKRRAERKKLIIKAMRPYFQTEEKTELYVKANLERKQRNLICRRIRMCRKANLQNFNYFCTFTYDDKKHTEESFRKKLKGRLSSFAKRRGWKYIGVWERSPKTSRLHFHGIFHIPEGTLPGILLTHRDYSTTAHKMQIRNQSTYFNDEFGRSDFEPINDNRRMGEAMAYLMKYLEKTGEKIIYSKGLPQYFISDILDDDIVCTVGQEEKKLLLFDDFNCFDEGCYVGEVSPAVIAELRKSN